MVQQENDINTVNSDKNSLNGDSDSQAPVAKSGKFNKRSSSKLSVKKSESEAVKPIDKSQLQESYNLTELKKQHVDSLLPLAQALNIENASSLQKQTLVLEIMTALIANDIAVICQGVLEILPDGYGFLRSASSNYAAGPDDIYIAHGHVKNGLRTGDVIEGTVRSPRRNEKYFALSYINKVNEMSLNDARTRPHFDDLTPLFPNDKFALENAGLGEHNICSRIIDIVAPLGRGQRALVVAPPRTGKTFLMQNVAHAITSNYPDIELMVLLVGERPEEVTEMSRSIAGEVISSTFDEPSQRHVQLAEIAIEKAKRSVENKKDVVILLDSITRLARAYNEVAPSSGKILSGGVDSNSLQKPKRFFGAARNIEEGGSLTIIATALIETGSRMEEVIFEEFKGTGNMEVVLDRKISDKRIFPAIDINKSGTRREDLLLSQSEINKIWVLRRITNNMSTSEALEFLKSKLKDFKTNRDFFNNMDTNGSK